jgi:hypothetical protein
LGFSAAEIVDGVAVVVDGKAIKQSDISNEIRVTDFLNGAKLDLSIAAQKEAASRLIDQKIIRKTMEAGLYPLPAPAEADRLLQQVRQRYPGDSAYRRGLAAYGISEEMLKQHLLWQLAVLRFIGLRFQAAAADRESGPRPEDSNQQFFAWLDQSRNALRIEFKTADLRGDAK